MPKHKLLLIHVPKTGGNAIYESLPEVLGTHKNIFGMKKRSKLPMISFVRNPWDRLVSAYYYLEQGGMNNFDKKNFKKHLEKFDDFKDFVYSLEDDSSVINKVLHLKPQKFFVCVKGKIKVDEVYRFENLEDDFNQIVEKYNLKISKPFKKHNSSNHPNYQECYDDKMIEIVKKVYSEDIKLFNYSFDNKIKLL